MRIRINATALATIVPLVIPAFHALAQSTAVNNRPMAVSRQRVEALTGHTMTPTSDVRVVRASGAVERPTGSATIPLAARDFVFAKTADTAQRLRVRPSSLSGGTHPAIRPNAKIYVMPYRVLSVDSSGVERMLVPYVIIDGGGLTYNVATRAYRGTAFIGVEDSLTPNAARVSLPQSLGLQLTTTTGGAKVVPRELTISHTGIEYESVTIESPDSTALRVRTSADAKGIVIPVPVDAVALGVRAMQDSIEAFGIATTNIEVTLPRGMTRADTAVVAPFGIIVAIASAIGLDLLELKIEDAGAWIAIVLTAALGAWVGARLLGGIRDAAAGAAR